MIGSSACDNVDGVGMLSSMGSPSGAMVNCSAEANDSVDDDDDEEMLELVRCIGFRASGRYDPTEFLSWPNNPSGASVSTSALCDARRMLFDGRSAILVPTPAPTPLKSAIDRLGSGSCAPSGDSVSATSLSLMLVFAQAQSKNLTASCTMLLGTFLSTMNRGMPPPGSLRVTIIHSTGFFSASSGPASARGISRIISMDS